MKIVKVKIAFEYPRYEVYYYHELNNYLFNFLGSVLHDALVKRLIDDYSIEGYRDMGGYEND